MVLNILIYDNLKNVNNSNLSIKVYEKNLIKYNKKIYLLYDAKEINPPFFDNIIIIRNNLSEEDLKMLYNMTKVNGTIISSLNYNIFFSNGKFSNSQQTKTIEKNYFKYKKINNIVYTIPYTRVVDFIIMGTQKGGTTALALNIGKHPDIYLDPRPDPRISEVHFFDLHWKKGIEWYKKKFDYSKKLVGEKTPDLMYLDYTFPLIQSVNPYVKIILILRDPIKRAHSAWKMVKEFWNESRSFEEAVNDELANKLTENKTFYTSQTHYLQRGLYYKQIKNILKWFPKEHLLVLISEKVKENMLHEYNKVYQFLNLPQYSTNYKLEFSSNDKSTVDKKLYNKLINFYKKDVSQLEKFLKIKTNWFSAHE
jgi:hypothetical protein